MTWLRPCLISSLVACACFADPPSSDTGLEASTSSDPSITGPSTGGDVGTSGSSVGEVTSHGVTSSVDSSSESSAGSSDDADSSGGEPSCECIASEVLCTSFEPPFDPTVSPWGVPAGGGSVAPTLVNEPAACGRAALRTAVAPGDLYSVANAGVMLDLGAVGPHRVEVSVWIEPQCLATPTRALLVQLPGEVGIWYQFAVWLSHDNVELRLQNHAGLYQNDDAVVPLAAGEWHTLQLDVSVDSSPPTASLALDGELALPNLVGPASSAKVEPAATQAINLGIYRDDLPFDDECAITYDDLRVTTL